MRTGSRWLFFNSTCEVELEVPYGPCRSPLMASQWSDWKQGAPRTTRGKAPGAARPHPLPNCGLGLRRPDVEEMRDDRETADEGERARTVRPNFLSNRCSRRVHWRNCCRRGARRSQEPTTPDYGHSISSTVEPNSRTGACWSGTTFFENGKPQLHGLSCKYTNSLCHGFTQVFGSTVVFAARKLRLRGCPPQSPSAPKLRPKPGREAAATALRTV